MKYSKSKEKGFYIALIASVAMIGTACWFAYSQTTQNLENQLDYLEESTAEITETQQEVDKPQTDIPKETVTAKPAVTQTEPVVTTEQAVIKIKPATSNTKNTASIMPVENGEVISEFSNGELVKSLTTNAWQTHNGIDISAEVGTEIKCIANGTVSEIANDALWGVVVTVDHGGGLITKYCGLNEALNVQAGETVNLGSALGTLAKNPDIESAEPSHLHFEMLKNGAYVNPLEYISK